VAAGLAYRNLTEQDIDEMEEVFENMKEAAKREDFMEYLKHHLSYHEIFIKASENETLISILENLRMHTLWHRYTYHYYKEDFRNSLKIHRRILDLFKEKKVTPEEVEKAVRDHIERALQPFLKAMEELEGEAQEEDPI
jgi:DNA-binding GntR family transcriptional regulator